MKLKTACDVYGFISSRVQFLLNTIESFHPNRYIPRTISNAVSISLESLDVSAVPCICRYRTSSRQDLGQSSLYRIQATLLQGLITEFECPYVKLIQLDTKLVNSQLIKYEYLVASPTLMDEVYMWRLQTFSFIKIHKEDYKQTQLECYASTERRESLTELFMTLSTYPHIFTLHTLQSINARESLSMP